MKRNWLTIAGLIVLTLVAAGLLFGCAGKVTEPYEDADRGEQNKSPADTLTFPDGFSNVATKCDHGNRVYVLFKGDAAYGAIAVVENAKGC